MQSKSAENPKSVSTQFSDQTIDATTAAFIAQLDSFEVVGAERSLENVAWKTDLDRFSIPVLSERVHDLAWLRPGAMSHLNKRYMRLDTKLSAGQTFQVRINASLSTVSYGARKEVFLTTLSPLGGRDNTLGMFLLCSGFACLGAAVIVLAIQSFCPRQASAPRGSLIQVGAAQKDVLFAEDSATMVIPYESELPENVQPSTVGAPQLPTE